MIERPNQRPFKSGGPTSANFVTKLGSSGQNPLQIDGTIRTQESPDSPILIPSTYCKLWIVHCGRWAFSNEWPAPRWCGRRPAFSSVMRTAAQICLRQDGRHRMASSVLGRSPLRPQAEPSSPQKWRCERAIRKGIVPRLVRPSIGLRDVQTSDQDQQLTERRLASLRTAADEFRPEA